MKNISIRLTQNQVKRIHSLARKRDKTPSELTRELLEYALDQQDSNGKNAYQQYTTSAAVETLILLRKLAENNSPELVPLAQSEARTVLAEANLLENQ